MAAASSGVTITLRRRDSCGQHSGPAGTVAVSPVRLLLTRRNRAIYSHPMGNRFPVPKATFRIHAWDVVGWCPRVSLVQLASLGEPVASPTHFKLIIHLFI